MLKKMQKMRLYTLFVGLLLLSLSLSCGSDDDDNGGGSCPAANVSLPSAANQMSWELTGGPLNMLTMGPVTGSNSSVTVNANNVSAEAPITTPVNADNRVTVGFNVSGASGTQMTTLSAGDATDLNWESPIGDNHSPMGADCTLCTQVVDNEVRGVINNCTIDSGYSLSVHFRADSGNGGSNGVSCTTATSCPSPDISATPGANTMRWLVDGASNETGMITRRDNSIEASDTMINTMLRIGFVTANASGTQTCTLRTSQVTDFNWVNPGGDHPPTSDCSLCTQVMGSEVIGIMNNCRVSDGHIVDVRFRVNIP